MKLTRRLLPRLFLLLTVMMVVSALTWATLFVFAEQAPRARNYAQLLTSVANITRSALVAASPERRGDLLLELTQQEGVRIYAAEPDEPPAPEPSDSFLVDVLSHLRRTLGPNTQLTTERYGNSGVFVLVDIEGDNYWIGFPRGRFDRSRSLQWIGWGAVAALFALLTAVLFVSRLTRPLKHLAEHARLIGTGTRLDPLVEEGPEEIADVAAAFNQMMADLDRLDQDRALILAGISHDLRTPLTRLRMGIELTATDEGTRDGMIADVEEMDRTIGQFLDFARVGENIAMQPEDLRALIAEIVEQYQRRGIQVAQDVRDVGRTPVHRANLRRAITNLVDNALRHAGGNDAAIEVGLRREDAHVIIEVRDRGPGVPAGETDRMLRPFTRLDTARSNASGAGLGLAIVDRIVRQHGGNVSLLPRPGGGLIVRMTIPLFKDRDRAPLTV